jgi:preprotein translocase subunit SecG
MLYTICIVAILIASICLILAVLVQSPKSGMAANFGVSNQVMGVRETANFLEKFTWTMVVAIVVLSLVATLSMDKASVSSSNNSLAKDAETLINSQENSVVMPQATVPTETSADEPANETPAEGGEEAAE